MSEQVVWTPRPTNPQCLVFDVSFACRSERWQSGPSSLPGRRAPPGAGKQSTRSFAAGCNATSPAAPSLPSRSQGTNRDFLRRITRFA
jgi:hypothetical protein